MPDPLGKVANVGAVTHFNDALIKRHDLPADVFGLIHDLAYDHEGRDRWQYRNRAQEILKVPHFLADAKTTPGGNKTLPRCEVPDCVNQASFIINERALCKTHVGRNESFAVPPSLRKE